MRQIRPGRWTSVMSRLPTLKVFRAFALAATMGSAPPAIAAESLNDCAVSSLLAGPCTTFHGRLTLCTGIPNARIWVIGTKRILGVTDTNGNPAGEALLPAWIDDKLTSVPPCSRAAFGDFTVCPLTADRAGAMQKVCVVEAARIRFQDDW